MTATYDDDLRDAARAAGQVANYCDRGDHNEAVEASWVVGAGDTFRMLAVRIAIRESVNIQDAYADRLGAIEARNVVSAAGGFDGGEAARAAVTWQDLQVVQLRHDREYHPDVIGLHKSEQLRHYAFHLSKLVAAIAEEPSAREQHADFLARRLPDMLLFGLKLATVMNHKLPETALAPQYVVPAAA
jgi:hypothetical protein